MPFTQFAFPQVCTELGLKLAAGELFAGVAPLPPRPEFAAELADDVKLASAVHTEKARSEFVIAPLLLELRRRLSRKVSLLSGVELNVDPGRGLAGVCDFLITGSANAHIVESPLLVVAEAKADATRSGLGQCIAATLAARLFNEHHGSPAHSVFGVSTTGTAWKFLRLDGDTVTLDDGEHLIDDPGRILGILRHIVETA